MAEDRLPYEETATEQDAQDVQPHALNLAKYLDRGSRRRPVVCVRFHFVDGGCFSTGGRFLSFSRGPRGQDNKAASFQRQEV